jgi:serine/threonine protein kinase
MDAIKALKTGRPESANGRASKLEDGRWKRGRSVGEGGQAKAISVEDTLKEYPGLWVLKKLRKFEDPTAKARFGREVNALQSLNHPNIVKIIHSNLAAQEPYYVAEYCESGSLEKIGASIYKGDIAKTMAVVLPILDALVAAHTNGIVHRDVTPDNIWFRGNGTPVIGDFGLSYMEGEERLTVSNERVGSPNFIAPEMEAGQHHLGEPSDRTDVYSLGKVIYWMLSGGHQCAREIFHDPLADLLQDQ